MKSRIAALMDKPITANTLRARRIGIDTYQEPVVYMRADCHICRSEGFAAQSRILVEYQGRSVIATLNVISNNDVVAHGQAGLSEVAWQLLRAQEDESVTLSHSPPLESLRHVRAKVYGNRLSDEAMADIVRDVAARRYSDLHLAAFITACAGSRLDLAETVALTKTMVGVGERIDWRRTPVVDKHCVGGLPGNRTTPIVVAIVTACGLTMPKTSSRAITSPAGTADVMETLAPVDLDIPAMRRVVEREGGCVVWGGAVRLSPADDILIRVERPLDLDSEGQLVASVLSKKVAAGSSHVVIDIPVGPTAKVRSREAATVLAERLVEVGKALNLGVRVVLTDGTQPVGRGIGPALEARDVLAVLRGEPDAPQDLRERALMLAGEILEQSSQAMPGCGSTMARIALAEGHAWRKFQAICEAQGGMRQPPKAVYTHVVAAEHAGYVTVIDNRRLARVAKLAGAPNAPAAGLEFHTPLGSRVDLGQPLFTLHAEARGVLDYAQSYLETQHGIVTLGELT